MAMSLVLLLAGAVAVQAQGPGPDTEGGEGPDGPITVAEDPTGDHGLQVGGQDPDVHHWPAIDLEELTLDETDEALLFKLGLAGLGPDPQGVGGTIYYEIYFTAQGTDYQIDIAYHADVADASAWLRKEDPQWGFFFTEASLEPQVDVDAGAITTPVPHGLLLDEDGVEPLPGDMVRAFWADAFATNYQNEPATAMEDRMPDSGLSDATYEIRAGLQSSGHVFLHSPEPVRVSNGEATTFLFEVLVKNLAEFTDTFEPSYEGGREDWTITFPVSQIRLDGDEMESFPVLVTTPFNHEHGAYYPINITLESRADPLTVGRLELGVRYTKVPQPAGHHPTLYLHDDNGFIPYFNTLQDDAIPEDEQTGGMSASGCGFSGGSGSGSADLWPLYPALQLGIDFDLEREGTATFMVTSDTPSEGYRMAGGIMVFPQDQRPNACNMGNDEFKAAIFVESEPISIGAGETVEVTMPIRATDYGDYIPYDANLDMGFVVGFWDPETLAVPFANLITNNPPTVVADGTRLELPLNEYHDPVDDYFTSLSGIELTAETPQQRFVNPGETALFKVEATNIGGASGTFDLEVTGNHVEWVDALGDDRITLAGEASRMLAVSVSPPGTAADGDLVDITLHATKSDDPNVRSVIRLLAEVDTDADHIDEAAQAAATDEELSSKGLPAPGAAILLAALGATAFLVHRRR